MNTAPQDAANVHVALGDRAYDIHIGEGLLQQAGGLIAPLLARPHTVIVTDENVARLHLDTLKDALSRAGVTSDEVIVPAGEASKSYGVLQSVCDQLLEKAVERRDMVIAFGGGVVGDLAGFAAAILRRGIDFIQIPTSLLAQVDSSVGGKTGINSTHGKNLIGAFHQPRKVIIDIALLDSLPPRELRAGYAEVAKYGLLGDATFFSWLEDNADGLFAGNAQTRIKAISKSCEAKADIVGRDETEQGTRALLNLGHTFGHVLETATGYGERLLHGEGVSIGMAMAFRFCHHRGQIPADVAERVEKHLRACGLPTRLSDIEGDLPSAHQLTEMMRQDKKAQGGQLVFILVNAVGESYIARDVEAHDVTSFLESELKGR